MAAVALLALLLFAFISNIHSGEKIFIEEKGDYYTFRLDDEAYSSCLISRSVGEEKLVLWNTSVSSSENSTLPDGLKQRLTVIRGEDVSRYTIDNLTHSDSGLYREQCWTDGNVTLERNTEIIICSKKGDYKTILLGRRETVDLRCGEADDNLEIQWLMSDRDYGVAWTRVFWDGATSVKDIVEGGFQVVRNASGPHQSNITRPVIGEFTCLVMNQQQCVRSREVRTKLPEETMYRSVGETAVLQCTGTQSSEDKPPQWVKKQSTNKYEELEGHDGNHSLVLSSLTLNDSGWYTCKDNWIINSFILVVCPTFGPPEVELFSGGEEEEEEEVTIRCGDVREGETRHWFMKSLQTQGQVVHQEMFDRNRMTFSDKLVISNVSLEDTGEYWCAVVDSKRRCVSTSKSLVMYRDPFGVYSTFYTARCVVFSILLVALCVILVIVNLKTM